LELPVYVKVFEKVVTHIETTRRPEIGSMVFDKDDVDALEFVVAAANVRAFNFGIELDSAFKIKELAGKIIPAISSSNALVASMQVHESIKLLLNHTDKLKVVFYARLDKEKRLSSAAREYDQRTL
jgi:ubiquitin-like 1-activating enzyme E1 B